ncbi:microfibril-associated glycoprotein 4-like [Pocillopora verrucosa]|uniref:microfibril-associated glycoprotein 4-like n=1 Tax=Pocillopora verrucosa TaxID=203993 RepID=UPI00333FB3BA
MDGKQLNGSVIKEIKVESESSCRLECVNKERCKSYNFGSTKKKSERWKCQISDSDRFERPARANFIENKEFGYRGIKSLCERDKSNCGKNEICIVDIRTNSARCICKDGYTRKPCEPIPKSCALLYQDGVTSSGVYTINPDGGNPIQVLCDMTTNGGAWTVFQRRLNGSIDFYRDWSSYKNGFGDLKGEFWLGNDNLHRLTAAGNVSLRVDLEDFEGNIRYAEYATFKVADQIDKYRILIGGYSGTAGDGMNKQSDMQFSTRDSDNDINPDGSCAQQFKGAWWYSYCHHSNLNGLYLNGSHSSMADGVNWIPFKGYYYSLKRTEMKVK